MAASCHDVDATLLLVCLSLSVVHAHQNTSGLCKPGLDFGQGVDSCCRGLCLWYALLKAVTGYYLQMAAPA